MNVAHNAAGRQVVIDFDRPLDTGATPNLSTLTWVQTGQIRASTFAVFTGASQLTYAYANFGIPTGDAAGGYYTASPAWLTGAGGTPVAPFSGLT